MNYQSALAAAVLLASLSACGGGGGGSSPPPAPPPPPPPPPRIDISLSADSASATVNEGEAHTVVINATAVATGNVTSVVPDLDYDTSVFEEVKVAPGAANGTYVVTARTVSYLTGGDHQGEITFRLCRQAECTQVYTGSTQTFTLDLTVNLREWSTFQRDNRHTGYVPVILDHTKFKKAWEWKAPSHVSPTVTGDGNVYVSSGNSVVALSESDGSEVWRHKFLDVDKFDIQLSSGWASTYVDGKLYVTAQGGNAGVAMTTGDSAVRVLNGSDGTYIHDYIHASQTRDANSPYVDNDEMFLAKGYYGGIVWKYNLKAKKTSWKSVQVVADASAGYGVTADDNNVYALTGNGLVIYDRDTGEIKKKIVDRDYIWTGTNQSAPIILTNGNVLYRGGARFYVIDPTTYDLVWSSDNGYGTQMSLDAGSLITYHYPTQSIVSINVLTGNIDWRFGAPHDDPYIESNIITTGNLLFFSTQNKTYAVNMNGLSYVWSYNEGGNSISLSSNFILYISRDVASDSNFKLIAIKLK